MPEKLLRAAPVASARHARADYAARYGFAVLVCDGRFDLDGAERIVRFDDFAGDGERIAKENGLDRKSVV